ncbi:ABC-2 transporter permease [Cohnella fermenti]|uniref:ABC-2 transporter permease n=1 Tax=Cohnella fermenti TaxID=2565925 RepID=A0A4V3WG86_9BACL|nr:ABC-2 transporter permease [Cohnella fermenti]THF83267.1 hypothetical protein E6C55_05270 [Cohnella fermenti]
MYNLLLKDLKLGVSPLFFVLPLFTGALMLIPGWLYLLVPMYFCWITIPNMFGGYKSQNDLMFTSMMPVTKKDMVKARVSVIVILELLHLVVAMIFGAVNLRLYADMTVYFFEPHPGFWGLCFAMLAIFNLLLIPMYYKTAYKYGAASTTAIAGAMIFAGVAQWAGIQSPYLADLFSGSGADNTAAQASLLLAGVLVYAGFTFLAYRMAIKRFLKVEIQ